MRKKLAIDISTVICIIFVCLFSLIFLGFMINAKPGLHRWYSILSACLSFAAFTCCGVIFIRKLAADIGGIFRPEKAPAGSAETAARPPFKAAPRDVLFIALGVTFFFAATLLAVELLRIVNVGGTGFSHFEKLWSSLDSRHYLYIAEFGYTADTPDADIGRVVEIVFFPLFPAIVSVLGRIIGSFFIAGLIVSYVSFGFAMYFLFRLVAEEYGRISGYAAIVAIMILPGSFFFVAPMTESLFLAFTFGAVYFIKKERWLAAAVMGFFSALTRNLGVLVAAIYVYELLLKLPETVRRCRAGAETTRKAIPRFIIRLLFAVLIPAGTLVYLLINHRIYGNAFAFMEYEKSNWNQSLGWFFSTAEYCVRYMADYLKDPARTQKGYSLWAMNLFAHFGVLALLISRHRKLRTSYYGYSLVYFAVSMGVTWLLSGTRYMLGLFVLPLMLPGIRSAAALFEPGNETCGTPERRRKALASVIGAGIFAAVMIAVGVLYAIAFVKRLQVW
ncbi:MAG: hypothetical protein ILO53_00085 [Clostridia bacterium]|nr:hypothetical protein [Clostridia bacterium]